MRPFCVQLMTINSPIGKKVWQRNLLLFFFQIGAGWTTSKSKKFSEHVILQREKNHNTLHFPLSGLLTLTENNRPALENIHFYVTLPIIKISVPNGFKNVSIFLLFLIDQIIINCLKCVVDTGKTNDSGVLKKNGRILKCQPIYSLTGDIKLEVRPFLVLQNYIITDLQ